MLLYYGGKASYSVGSSNGVSAILASPPFFFDFFFFYLSHTVASTWSCCPTLFLHEEFRPEKGGIWLFLDIAGLVERKMPPVSRPLESYY